MGTLGRGDSPEVSDGHHCLSLSLSLSLSLRRCSNGNKEVVEEEKNRVSKSTSYCAGLITGSWSDLPRDIVEKIAEAIIYHSDLCRFGAVCKTWRSAVIQNRERLPSSFPLCHFSPGQLPLPLLMRSYTGDMDSHEFLCLSDGKVYGGFVLPELGNKRIAGSSKGWLVLIDMDNEEICLLNPFTRAQIHLPHMTSFLMPIYFYQDIEPVDPDGPPDTFEYVQKAIVSSDPKTPGGDCIVVAIVSCYNVLSCCRVGEDKWTYIKESPIQIHDVIYHKGSFYAVDHFGVVVAFDGIDPDTKVTIIAGMPVSGNEVRKRYLVESSSGELLLVERKQRFIESIGVSKTCGFKVYQLRKDLDAMEAEVREVRYLKHKFHFVKEHLRFQWIPLESLGGDMLFLGNNTSVAVPSVWSSQCKGDCIYFLDDDFKRHPTPVKVEHDIGIYDMENRRFMPYEPDDPCLFMPPVWFTPNPW